MRLIGYLMSLVLIAIASASFLSFPNMISFIMMELMLLLAGALLHSTVTFKED